MTQQIQKKKDPTIESLVRNLVSKRIEIGAIDLPDNYSYENAISTAYMVIGETKGSKAQNKPATEICTKESIVMSMYRMVTEGLNPFKNQCAFIVRGNKLTYQREYQGSIALAKRFSGVKRVDAQVVYSEDEVDYQIENGILKVASHKRGSKRSFDDIVGAYCVITEADGTLVAEEMTMDQIKKAWEQRDMNGASPAHKNFKDQMCLKTVINRACKPYINQSDDSAIMGGESAENGIENSPEEIETMQINVEAVSVEEEESVDIKTPEPVDVKEENTSSSKRGF